METKHCITLIVILIIVALGVYGLVKMYRKAIVNPKNDEFSLIRIEASLYYREMIKLDSVVDFYRKNSNLKEPKPIKVN